MGYSVIELMFITALVICVTATAVPAAAGVADEIQAGGAARYLVSRLRLARFEAVNRAANVGISFHVRDGRYEFGAYLDGNGDGVRARDISRGVDPPLGSAERLPVRFPGVDFGLIPGVPAIDDPTGTVSTDPIRIGSSDILSFSAGGSSSSGTLYFRGKGSQQYAVRILGVTGRVRVWRYDVAARTWIARP